MSYLFYKLKGEMILKLNVIEIVSIFLLAILMLGAVSASDELTADNDIDVLSVNDDSELSIDDNDYGTGEDDILKVSNGDNSDIEDEVDPVLQSEDANDLATGSQNPNIKIYGESGSNNFTYDQFTINNVVIELPADAGDNFTISVRDKEIPEWTKSYHNWYKNDSKIFLNAYNFYGKFNVTIKYNGNDIYSPCIKTENFTNKAVIVYEDSLIYKEGSTFVELYLPWAASGDLVVVIDGNKTIRENFRDHYDAIEPDERSAVAISPYSLDYGTHSVHAYYDGAYEVERDQGPAHGRCHADYLGVPVEEACKPSCDRVDEDSQHYGDGQRQYHCVAHALTDPGMVLRSQVLPHERGCGSTECRCGK